MEWTRFTQTQYAYAYGHMETAQLVSLAAIYFGAYTYAHAYRYAYAYANAYAYRHMEKGFYPIFCLVCYQKQVCNSVNALYIK